MGYRTCPYCGANLDADEKCECQNEDPALEWKNESGGASRTETEDYK